MSAGGELLVASILSSLSQQWLKRHPAPLDPASGEHVPLPLQILQCRKGNLGPVPRTLTD